MHEVQHQYDDDSSKFGTGGRGGWKENVDGDVWMTDHDASTSDMSKQFQEKQQQQQQQPPNLTREEMARLLTDEKSSLAQRRMYEPFQIPSLQPSRMVLSRWFVPWLNDNQLLVNPKAQPPPNINFLDGQYGGAARVPLHLYPQARDMLALDLEDRVTLCPDERHQADEVFAAVFDADYQDPCGAPSFETRRAHAVTCGQVVQAFHPNVNVHAILSMRPDRLKKDKPSGGMHVAFVALITDSEGAIATDIEPSIGVDRDRFDYLRACMVYALEEQHPRPPGSNAWRQVLDPIYGRLRFNGCLKREACDVCGKASSGKGGAKGGNGKAAKRERATFCVTCNGSGEVYLPHFYDVVDVVCVSTGETNLELMRLFRSSTYEMLRYTSVRCLTQQLHPDWTTPDGADEIVKNFLNGETKSRTAAGISQKTAEKLIENGKQPGAPQLADMNAEMARHMARFAVPITPTTATTTMNNNTTNSATNHSSNNRSTAAAGGGATTNRSSGGSLSGGTGGAATRRKVKHYLTPDNAEYTLIRDFIWVHMLHISKHYKNIPIGSISTDHVDPLQRKEYLVTTKSKWCFNRNDFHTNCSGACYFMVKPYHDGYVVQKCWSTKEEKRESGLMCSEFSRLPDLQNKTRTPLFEDQRRQLFPGFKVKGKGGGGSRVVACSLSEMRAKVLNMDATNMATAVFDTAVGQSDMKNMSLDERLVTGSLLAKNKAVSDKLAKMKMNALADIAKANEMKKRQMATSKPQPPPLLPGGATRAATTAPALAHAPTLRAPATAPTPMRNSPQPPPSQRQQPQSVPRTSPPSSQQQNQQRQQHQQHQNQQTQPQVASRVYPSATTSAGVLPIRAPREFVFQPRHDQKFIVRGTMVPSKREMAAKAAAAMAKSAAVMEMNLKRQQPIEDRDDEQRASMHGGGEGSASERLLSANDDVRKRRQQMMHLLSPLKA